MQMMSYGRTMVNINGEIGPFFPTLLWGEAGRPLLPVSV